MAAPSPWRRVLFGPPEAPLWLALSGNFALALIVAALAALLLPRAVVASLPKPLRVLRGWLLAFCRRVAELSAKGPFGAVILFCGRRIFGSWLASRCQPPEEVKARVAGCSEVHVSFTPNAAWNLFHQETYVLSWRRAGAEGERWQERPLLEDSRCSVDKATGRMKFLVRELPEGAELRLRLCSKNARGASPWSPEVKLSTFVRPTEDLGGKGPLGPASAGGTYTWTQTRSEVGVRIPLPASRRGRDLKVRPLPTKLEIRCCEGGEGDGQLLLGGALPRRIKVDEVIWNLEEDDEQYGRHLHVQLPKAEDMEKWPCLIEGHPKIDMSFVKFKGSGVAGLDIWE